MTLLEINQKILELNKLYSITFLNELLQFLEQHKKIKFIVSSGYNYDDEGGNYLSVYIDEYVLFINNKEIEIEEKKHRDILDTFINIFENINEDVQLYIYENEIKKLDYNTVKTIINKISK